MNALARYRIAAAVVRNLTSSWIMSMTLVTLACGKAPMQELARITSPDGVVDVVLVETSVGATVATPSEVYVVPKGSKVNGAPLLRADHMEHLNVRWKQPRLLEVSYSKGRIFSFTNFWESADVQNWKYIVEVELAKE